MSEEVTLAHARLSASGSKKWIACPRSVALEATFPDEKSEFAAEGTYAHTLFATAICKYLGMEPPAKPSAEDVTRFHTLELADSVAAAVDAAKAAIDSAREGCRDAIILVEQRLDFSRWVPEGFGTGDLVIVTDQAIHVLDLKMGKGVLVDAANNSQFRLYMLGALNTFGHLYDATTVIGTVLQPRLHNYASESMSAGALLQWADDVLVPAATAAWNDSGDFVAGSHCSDGFCRARFTCRARAEHSYEIARQDFALQAPQALTTEQIARVLDKADLAIKWLNDVKGYALEQAVAGREFAGYKLVEGRSNRAYANQDAVAAKLVESGIPEALIYERSLLGVTAMEKTLGKKKFAEMLGDLVVKPQGKPVLVPVDDKRSALNPLASAISDFSQP